MSGKTEQQLQNLLEALVWWATVPEANVAPRLCHFTMSHDNKTNCGTVACFGGWAARWPNLVAQGLNLTVSGGPRFGRLCDYDAAAPIFGDAMMFHPRDCHEADAGFKGSDHELVTNRIRWALEH